MSRTPIARHVPARHQLQRKMPSKARANVLRGPGRPKKAAEPAPVIAKSPPAKRGRPAKVEAVEAAAEPPKKRGRPAKVETVEAAAETPKKRGRPAKAKVEEEEAAPVAEEAPKRGRRSLIAPEPVAEALEPAATPKKRPGRPRKEEAAVEEAAPPPKKRGRPSKADALDLSRVAGTPRVSKRALRDSAPMFSRLRTRLPPAQKITKEQPVAPKAGKRGRPRKATVAAPAPKKAAVGRKPTKAVIKAPTKPSKPAAPCKRRGYTTLEVPDKFAAQMKQHLQQLLDGNVSSAIPDEAEETDEGGDMEENVLLNSAGVEDGDTEDGLVDSEHEQEVSDDIVPDMYNEEIQDEEMQDEDIQALVAHDEESKVDEDDILDQAHESVQEVDVDLNVQEIIDVEQDADGDDVLYHQEVTEQLVVRSEGPDEPQSSSGDGEDDDRFIREPSRPSATAAIFG